MESSESNSSDYPQHKTLAHAVLAVMREVPYIQKTKKKGGLNYAFVSEEEMLEKLHDCVTRHGIVIMPVDATAIRVEQYQTKSGATMQMRIFRYVFEFCHADSGQTKNVVAIGEAADVGDKACNKAATIALKYALRQGFLIQTGDDPDKVASVEAAPMTPRQTSQAPVSQPVDTNKMVNEIKMYLRAAKSCRQLDNYRDAYTTSRGLSREQIAELDIIYSQRYDTLPLRQNA